MPMHNHAASPRLRGWKEQRPEGFVGLRGVSHNCNMQNNG
jgi:hypothetical protein